MKRCVPFLMALLFAISCSYRSSATDETGQIARDLNEMEEFLKDRRENWVTTYFTVATEPSTRLVLVMEGVD